MSSKLPVSRRNFLTSSAAAFALSTAYSKAAYSMAHFVRVGVIGPAQEEIWQVVAENAKHEAGVLQIVPFEHYNDANDALAEHRIDINAFQDRFFLDDQNSMKGYDLISVGQVWVAPLTMYSSRYKALEVLPAEGMRIAIPEDPTNEARALRFLQKKGFIRLPSSFAGREAIIDIVSNLRKCLIEKHPVAALPQAIKDYDLVLMPSDFVSAASLKGPDISANLLTQETVQGNPYITLLVTNASDGGARWLGLVSSALTRPNVEQAITRVYQGSVYPAWKF